MESSQRARDYAIQTKIDTINLGLTETEVKEIVKSEGEKILAEMKLAAHDLMLGRIDSYTNILLPSLIRGEVLQAFSDPAIQVLLNKTQKVAICTDREIDYEMLSELLVHRVKKDNDYVKKAAINKAVDIINDISEEALLALTLLFAIVNIYPEAGISNVGLQVVDSLYGKLIDNNQLPKGKDWIDNLEILQVIKVIPFSGTSSYLDFIINNMEGYFLDGIRYESEKYQEVVENLNSAGLSENILVENPYLTGYYLIPVIKKDKIKDIKINRKISNDKIAVINITEEQIELLQKIYTEYERNSNNLLRIKTKFKEEIDKYPNMKKISIWWDENIANYNSLEITTVGRLLAQLNSKRLDDRVPNLEK